MRKDVIFYIMVLILLVFFSVIFYYSNLTGKVVEEINYYTYTKAMCNGTNYCEDYEIVCEDKDTISITPTGAAIQFSDEWKDPRDKELIEKLC